MRKDAVTPELRAAVLKRDLHACVAPRLGATRPCFGRLTLDHIKSEPRLGVRAPSDLNHLVTICQGHSEDGMRAGFAWNTANRPRLREYLATMRAGEELVGWLA